jgi:hypothetical protein
VHLMALASIRVHRIYTSKTKKTDMRTLFSAEIQHTLDYFDSIDCVLVTDMYRF